VPAILFFSPASASVNRIARMSTETHGRPEDVVSAGCLAGAWAIDLGAGTPLKTRREVATVIPANGGTIALTPASRGTTFFLTCAEAIAAAATPGTTPSITSSKVRTAWSCGVAVVTREYVDACLAAAKQLDPWPYRYLGTARGTDFGPSLAATVARPAERAARAVVAVASVAFAPRVLSAVRRGLDNIVLLCRGRYPPDARAAAPRSLPMLLERLFNRPCRLQPMAVKAFVLTAVTTTKTTSTKTTTATTTSRMSVKARLEAAKAERLRLKEEAEARRRAEKAAEKAEIAANSRRSINAAAMRAQREEQREQRKAALAERAAQRAAEAAARKAELERAAVLRRAELDKARREQQRLRNQLREAFSRTRAAIAEDMAKRKSAVALELEEAAALAAAEVEERERERQRHRELAKLRAMRAARIARKQRMEAAAAAIRQRRAEKAVQKAERRALYVEAAARAEQERKLQKMREWQERQRKKAERAQRRALMEEKNRERRARGLKELEMLGPIHLRKVFVGALKFTDIAEAKPDVVATDAQRAMLRQTRINETCKLFRRFGKVTQWLPDWERGFVHVVYKTVAQATRCLKKLTDYADRVAICEEIRDELEKSRGFSTALATLAAPSPHFYVRETRAAKSLASDPDRELIRAAAERRREAEKALAAAAEAQAASSRRRGGGRGRGRGGRGGRGRGRGRGRG